jgi:hypothetical protein
MLPTRHRGGQLTRIHQCQRVGKNVAVAFSIALAFLYLTFSWVFYLIVLNVSTRAVPVQGAGWSTIIATTFPCLA